MTEEEILQYARAFGADLSRWPEEVRSEAQSLINNIPELHDALLLEHDLDRLLGSIAAKDSTPAELRRLEAAIFAEMIAVPRPSLWRELIARAGTWQLVGMPVAAAAGVIAALLLPAATSLPATQADRSVLAAVFDMDPYGLDAGSGETP
jgi:hypothetical protein